MESSPIKTRELFEKQVLLLFSNRGVKDLKASHIFLQGVYNTTEQVPFKFQQFLSSNGLEFTEIPEPKGKSGNVLIRRKDEWPESSTPGSKD